MAAIAFLFLCFSLFHYGSSYLVCGRENQCKCGQRYVACERVIDGVPDEYRKGRTLSIFDFDTRLRLKDLLPDLDGYSFIEFYGDHVCGRKDLEAIGSLADCLDKDMDTTQAPPSQDSTTQIQIQTERQEEDHLLHDLRRAIIKYIVGASITSLAVGTTTCITLSYLMLGLMKTYRRINNLHMHTEKPPCIIRWTLFNMRNVYCLVRILCCCRECKSLEPPNLEGKLFIIVSAWPLDIAITPWSMHDIAV